MKKILYLLCFSLFFSSQLSAQQEATIEEMKELLGGTTAVAMYNTFLAVGLAADLFAANEDNKEITEILAEEQMAVSQNMQEMFGEIIANNAGAFSEEDREFLALTVATFTALEKFAKATYDWMQNPTNEKVIEEYDKQRLHSWQLISDILGLDD